MAITLHNQNKPFVGPRQKDDFTSAYNSLRLCQTGPWVAEASEKGWYTNTARFEMDWDMGPLFPYINAALEGTQYYEKPDYIKFMYQDRLCGLYPHNGVFTPVNNLEDAFAYLDQLSGFLIELHASNPCLQPDHRKFETVSPVDIFQLLPGTNCRQCGQPTCVAFAAALSRNRIIPSACPHLAPPVSEKAEFPIYDQEGNYVRTVSLAIDTRPLRETLTSKDARIARLESRLAQVEQENKDHFNAANARLPSPLTDREAQVLQLLSEGASNKEIAGALGISDHTVKSHVNHIFNKLGVNDRTQASVWAVSHGLSV